MNNTQATEIDDYESGWYGSDLQTRILLPLIIVLCLITGFAGLAFYQSERSKLLEELTIRGQAMSTSLAAYASALITQDHREQLESHIAQFIGEKKLIHKVNIYRNNQLYLSVNSNQLRDKVQPDTLKHYPLPIVSPIDDSVLGRVEVTLSTQNIDDYLSARIVQILILAAMTVFLASLFMAWLIRRVVIRPLEQLTHKIQIISMGRLNQPVVTFSWDEIGHLFRDINAMRIRFKRKQDELISAIVKRRHFDPQSWPVKSATALIIDDDPVIRQHISKLLEELNITAITADGGQQGLTLIAQQTFDIILLDLMMPEMTGYEVLSEIRRSENGPQPPVIVISSIEDKTSIIRALRGGASDYVIKPFNNDELSARINILLNSALRDRELNYLVDERITELKRQHVIPD